MFSPSDWTNKIHGIHWTGSSYGGQIEAEIIIYKLMTAKITPTKKYRTQTITSE